MIKLYIYCSVLIIGNVEVGLDIGMKFHQEVMEIVSYDILIRNGGKLSETTSRAKTSIQYVYPSMDKMYWIESPCKLSHKKFQDF